MDAGEGPDFDLLREVCDYQALLEGREPPESMALLQAMRRTLSEGFDLTEDEHEALALLRHRYGREMTELRNPELG
jgi:hypothetical protein